VPYFTSPATSLFDLGAAAAGNTARRRGRPVCAVVPAQGLPAQGCAPPPRAPGPSAGEPQPGEVVDQAPEEATNPADLQGKPRSITPTLKLMQCII